MIALPIPFVHSTQPCYSHSYFIYLFYIVFFSIFFFEKICSIQKNVVSLWGNLNNYTDKYMLREWYSPHFRTI